MKYWRHWNITFLLKCVIFIRNFLTQSHAALVLWHSCFVREGFQIMRVSQWCNNESNLKNNLNRASISSSEWRMSIGHQLKLCAQHPILQLHRIFDVWYQWRWLKLEFSYSIQDSILVCCNIPEFFHDSGVNVIKSKSHSHLHLKTSKFSYH